MIKLENVSKRYQMGEITVTALDDISLVIDPGEFVVVLGPSGSGKTTMLNLISGLDTVTSGQIEVNGRDITGANRKQLFSYRREMIGLIFQTFNLFPTLTAHENVQFAVDMRGRDEAEDIARTTLEDVGLGQRVDHFPHELSGGEQQRVAIARALATGNSVLLADEPTGELDFNTGVQILKLLKSQADDGRTVLVVTHNREIARTADRVVELSSGRIVRDGAPEGGTIPVAELHW
ncbi:MAG: ABC transporter ATP-binding protein [Chloroflexota bacterium]